MAPPIYSKGGCTNCKRRKKKCDERRPACTSCARMGFTCAYDPKQVVSYRGARKLSHDEVERLLNAETTIQELSEHTRRETFEYMQRSALAFYTPMCDVNTKDLSNLWQIALDDRLVRDSLVTCFSVVHGSTPRYGQLDRRVYGRALAVLRDRLEPQRLPETENLPVSISVNFLGLIDSAGPSIKGDPLQHFKALAGLIALIQPVKLENLTVKQLNVYLILLESLAYHVTLGVHTRDLESVYRLWERSRVFHLLSRMNPGGPERVSKSPLLCGQYMIYRLVLELTYLLRLSAHCKIADHKVDSLEATVLNLRPSIAEDFGLNQTGCQTVCQRVFSDIYQLYHSALRICVNALREPTEQLRAETDDVVASGLSLFVHTPMIEMSYSAITWPLKVLACADRDNAALHQVESQIDKVKMLLDPGHAKRLDMTLDKLGTLKKRIKSDSTIAKDLSRYLTPGLSLLQQQDGILA